jgi:flagellar hook-associated protein 2
VKEIAMIGNIANSLGLGSGINVSQLVSDLAAASRAPKAERFDALAKASQAKISAIAQARADLDSFADTLGNLVQSGSLSSQPTTSNDSALAASALTGSQLGKLSAEIEIRQLARAQTSASGLIVSAADPVGTGNVTLTVNGNPYSITIGPANNSLTGLADAINASGSGVRASIIADQGQARLVLKGEVGAAKAFTLSADVGADPALGALVATGLVVSQAASDAVIRVDGVEYNRPNNSISDVVPGVALTLKKAAIGEMITLGSIRSADALKQTIVDFVSVFNQLQSSLKAARQTIGGAGNLRALDRQLAGLVSRALTGNDGVNSLSDIGVKTDRSGTLVLDSAKLDAALAADPDAVEALFNPPRDAVHTNATDPGLAFALDEIRDAAVSSGGLIDSLGKVLESEAAAIAKNRAKMEAREDAFEARLEKQYAGLDARLAAFKATQSYLEQQIKLWSKET